MTSRARRHSLLLRSAPFGALVAVLLAGCALGERPTLTDDRMVDDAAIEAVLDRLNDADTATFTAVYRVQPSLAGAAPAEVTVRHTPERARITFATSGEVTVEYSDTDGEQRTCAARLTECVAGYDESRISNLGVTHTFWGASAVAKLQNAAGNIQTDASSSTETIAGQTATCATVPLTDTSSLYCAIAAGPLARYTGADVTIELISFEATVDPAAFG